MYSSVESMEDDFDGDMQALLPRQQGIKDLLSPECPDNAWKYLRKNLPKLLKYEEVQCSKM